MQPWQAKARCLEMGDSAGAEGRPAPPRGVTRGSPPAATPQPSFWQHWGPVTRRGHFSQRGAKLTPCDKTEHADVSLAGWHLLGLPLPQSGELKAVALPLGRCRGPRAGLLGWGSIDSNAASRAAAACLPRACGCSRNPTAFDGNNVLV